MKRVEVEGILDINKNFLGTKPREEDSSVTINEPCQIFVDGKHIFGFSIQIIVFLCRILIILCDVEQNNFIPFKIREYQ